MKHLKYSGREGKRQIAKAWFPLSQLRPRERPILSQNKAVSGKDDCSTTKSLCFCVVVVGFVVNGNQALDLILIMVNCEGKYTNKQNYKT